MLPPAAQPIVPSLPAGRRGHQRRRRRAVSQQPVCFSLCGGCAASVFQSCFVRPRRGLCPVVGAGGSGGHDDDAVTGRRRRAAAVCMAWKPAGMLRDAVDIKRAEIELLEQMLMDRPDHPVNMKRSFYAQEASHTLVNSLRRRDGSIAVMAAVKRFLAPSKAHKLDSYDDEGSDGGGAELVCAFPEIEHDVRALWACGVDAALFYTDAVRHGVELPELRRTARLFSSTGTPLPLVRHDLIIDPVQIAEAAEAGATAVNIVAAAALPDVSELLDAATMMGMEAIVECHTQLEVDYAMECGATVVFLNNWDRTRNVLVPGTAQKLVENIPPFVLTLAGGGFSSASECWELLDLGFNGVVLGTSLLQSRRPKGFIEEIRSYKRFTGDVFSGNMGVPFSEGSGN